MSAARQLWLDFGTQEHFRLLHGGHQSDVAVCTKADPQWTEHVYHHDEAEAMLAALAACPDLNVYQSQNGFDGRRLLAHLAAMTSVFVDLDVYRVPGLENIEHHELLDRIQARIPWLPAPSLMFNSGRGRYLTWLFTKPLTAEQLPRWQSVQDSIIEALEPFGADPACRDAPRVLRAVGSTHVEAGVIVTGTRTGDLVRFEQLERVVIERGTPAPRLRLAWSNQAELPDMPPREAYREQRGKRLAPYQLAFDRMADCHQLAQLRGSPAMSEHRHRLLYVYAVAGAWYWSGLEQAKVELRAFASQHFAGAERYQVRRVGTVLDRMEQGKAGIRGIWNGAAFDQRYRMNTDTIIRLLGITAVEQTRLRCVICNDEKLRRLREKRRASGMTKVSRTEYLDTAQQRRELIFKLDAEGKTQSEIAEAVGVSKQLVCNRLKEKSDGR